MNTVSDDGLLTQFSELLGPSEVNNFEPNSILGECSGASSMKHDNHSAQAEVGYESLFDNAICGIYRDSLDGMPIRANHALFNFNGYSSEQEHLDAVKRHRGSWYVDPDRDKYFQYLLNTYGCVRDLVSEVYRHRTREKAWITENAWYVRDSNGIPLYIEGTIQDATERVQHLAEIERQANSDMLTGLANRHCFMRQLNSAVPAAKGSVALLLIDLDKFKQVNDVFGHGAGDLVLRTVARRLTDIARGLDATVARLGGDEFSILIQELTPTTDVSIFAGAIVEVLRQPIEIEGHPTLVGASVGVSISPLHTISASDLLIYADLALYNAKYRGRNDFCIFNSSLKAKHRRRLELESELSAAIRDDALELYYQPIVDARSHDITSLEGLIRWNHPRRGMLSPAEFIPLAEDAGLMPALGDWVIGRACIQAAALPGHIRVAVNVSPSQLRSTEIIESVRRHLAASELAPARLILELTETAILGAETVVSQVVSELEKFGVGFALDDFGTGYSSLSYLQRFRFSEVKIDRSFVAEISTRPVNRAVVRAIVSIARDLKMDVVAEGIEDKQQGELLLREGCGYLQGYAYGKPKPFSEIAADLNVRLLRKTSRNQDEEEASSSRYRVHC